MTDSGRIETNAAMAALRERLRRGQLTVWAILLEDTYETWLGDGYFAYLDEVFLRPTQAAEAVEAAEQAAEQAPELGALWFHRHIRRYVLRSWGGDVSIRPDPTNEEPVTVQGLADKLAVSPWREALAANPTTV
jgi:hypothetical protein